MSNTIMTSVKEQLQSDLTVNLKAHNELEITVLRSVLGAVQYKEKAGKSAADFNDSQVLVVLGAELKKRRDTAAEWTRVNVLDRAERETAEADFLAQYLPVPLTNDEVEELVTAALATFEAPTMKDFGSVMKSVVAAADGRADGKLVSELVRAKLSA